MLAIALLETHGINWRSAQEKLALFRRLFRGRDGNARLMERNPAAIGRPPAPSADR